MKLKTKNIDVTQQSISVLKNFSTINSSIMIREGSLLNTQSLGENIIAEYDCDEEFPQDFAVYELNQFLAGLSLFDTPTLDFQNDSYVTIKNTTARRSAKFFFSDEEMVKGASLPSKIRFPEQNVTAEFRITQKDLDSLSKAGSIYDLEDLKVEVTEDGNSTVTLVDLENETNNTYSLHLQATCSQDTTVHFKVENIRLLPGDYDISLTDMAITRWKHCNLPLVYYIGIEPVDDDN